MKIAGLLGLIAVLCLGVYVRLAPADPSRWHLPPYPGSGTRATRDGFIVWRETGPGAAAEVMARLDRIIRATPRTRVFAGSPAEGMVTYVTRSRIWGFPDYTTVSQEARDQIVIHGRLRFGRSDLGVNRRRIEAWLARLDAPR